MQWQMRQDRQRIPNDLIEHQTLLDLWHRAAASLHQLAALVTPRARKYDNYNDGQNIFMAFPAFQEKIPWCSPDISQMNFQKLKDNYFDFFPVWHNLTREKKGFPQ